MKRLHMIPDIDTIKITCSATEMSMAMPQREEGAGLRDWSRSHAALMSWSAAVMSAVLVWGFMFGALFGFPNLAEALLGGGMGVAVAVVVRALVFSSLTS